MREEEDPTGARGDPTGVPGGPTGALGGPTVATGVVGDPTGVPGDPAVATGVVGDPTGVLGDPTGVVGDPTGVLGDPTGVLGDPTGVLGEPTVVTGVLGEPTAAPGAPTVATGVLEEPTGVLGDPTGEPTSLVAMGATGPLSKRAMAAVVAVLMAIVVFHPGFLNLLVRSEDADISLTQIQNIYYWNRYHQGAPLELTADSKISLGSVYVYPRRSYVIIHGFLSSGLDDWIIRLKDALLGREDCNVLSVTWAAGSLTAEYYIVNSRVPQVGEEVSRLLLLLQEAAGLTPDLVHLVGHSLGAHAAGFAGKKLNGTLGRITGLDPAGHMFHQAEPTTRLHKTDADFVDVIHTHGCTTIFSQWTDCYGIDENLGDADFWPNGGERQPACKEGGDGEASVKDGSSCDHGMSYVLYTESVSYPLSTTHFQARPCSNWRLYDNGTCPCSRPAQYMGYNANPNVHGVFYLNTNKTAPYALLDPECYAGAFSALQIACIILTTLFVFLLLLLSLHRWCSAPVLSRVRVALWLDSTTWTGLKESPLVSSEENRVDT